MFSCCIPRLRIESQAALILNLPCGFAVAELANAFLDTSSTVEKRISRAKRVLGGSHRLFELDKPSDVTERLPGVNRALYLLFNEGYHGASAESSVRIELCYEAIRLTCSISEHPLTASPATHALLALMYLNAARLPARMNEMGNLKSLPLQERFRWDPTLISKGEQLLNLSARGPELISHHLEAAIASVHAHAHTMEETDWEQIVSLYDQLLKLQPTPVVALNRSIAIAQARGPEQGLAEINQIAELHRLHVYPFYFAALGDLEFRRGQVELARDHFRTAAALARNPMERRFFEHRIVSC